MTLTRVLKPLAAIGALTATILIYTVHPAASSNHQDTFNIATTHSAANITDVYVFPAPGRPENVVLVMDTTPVVPAGLGAAFFFDPNLLYQFKIVHGPVGTTSSEDEVIQFTANGTGPTQTINVYGPAKPNEVGTVNTAVTLSGTVPYNNPAGNTLPNGVKVFAGPRADPFIFDLFGFFTFMGDRNFATHTSQSDPGAGNTPSNGDFSGPGLLSPPGDKLEDPNKPTFNGFAPGTTSGPNLTGYLCSNQPSQNTLTDVAGGFNVEALIVEVPRALLTAGYASPIVHVWATTSSPGGT
ncbi:MAG TPA: DUF4331 family protein [Candidatus Elarobacter sp.]|nr:DUF4331 family protein [Candidatus Elarobacter sp.]